MARIDHELTPKHQLFGRFLLFNQQQLFPFVPDTFAQNPSAPPGFGTNHDDTGRNLALGLTSVFRPTLINDFRFGYAYYFGTKEAQNIHSGFLESLGITRAPGATNDGIPAIDVPGYADMGDSDIFQPQIRKDNTFQFTDNVAWVRGRHTFKFGADVRRYRLFYLVEDFGQGVFSFSDGASSVSGTAFSDFLLGRPFLSYAQAGNSGGNDRLDYLGAYFSDEFHATPPPDPHLRPARGVLFASHQCRRTRLDSRSQRCDALHRAQRSGTGSGINCKPADSAPSEPLWAIVHHFSASRTATFADPAGLGGLGAAFWFRLRSQPASHDFLARRIWRFQFSWRTRLCFRNAA